MRLLVTGGAGYIGSVVTHRLVAAGHRVEVLDDLSTGHAEAVPAGVPLHRRDVRDIGRVLVPGFDGVLHLAARIAAGESVGRPELYRDVNVRGSLAVLDAVRAARVPRLVVSSTGSVYGTGHQAAGGLTEDARTAPANPYAASKLAVDLLVTGECGASGLAAASLRYFNAAGAGALGRLAERHDPETHLIPLALAAAAGGTEVRLYGDDYPTPDGTCVRDYVHVEDLATAHLLALDAVTPGRHAIWNLGNGTGYSNRQVLDAVRQVTGSPLPVVVAPRRAGDAPVMVADSGRARRELGWRPARPELADIVADAWDAYLSPSPPSASVPSGPTPSGTSSSTTRPSLITRLAGSGIPGQRSSGSGEL
jgi:UDP-glucose 4-epimerase